MVVDGCCCCRARHAAVVAAVAVAAAAATVAIAVVVVAATIVAAVVVVACNSCSCRHLRVELLEVLRERRIRVFLCKETGARVRVGRHFHCLFHWFWIRSVSFTLQ